MSDPSQRKDEGWGSDSDSDKEIYDRKRQEKTA